MQNSTVLYCKAFYQFHPSMWVEGESIVFVKMSQNDGDFRVDAPLTQYGGFGCVISLHVVSLSAFLFVRQSIYLDVKAPRDQHTKGPILMNVFRCLIPAYFQTLFILDF